MICFTLFITFLKIGAFTFGGGYAMLPLVQSEVISHGWMSAADIVNFIAVSESTPGPFAVNISTYIGMETAGIPGALCATFGVVLPSFIIILIVAKCFAKFKKSVAVDGCMTGLRPAVVGLIASAVISVGMSVFFPNGLSLSVSGSYAFVTSVIVFLIMIVLIFKKMHPIAIILLSAALGIICGFLQPYIPFLG